MSIFGRKSKSKGAVVEEKKPPPPSQQQQQQQQQSGAGNAARQGQNGVTKNGAPMQAPNGTPLSPAERTAQRAALMAASRKRMNSDNPDYSINGSFTSSTKAGRSSNPGSGEGKSAKSPHKTLVKHPKPGDDGKKKKKPNTVDASAPATIAAVAASQSSVPESEREGGEINGSKPTILGNFFHKTPPLPQDSPTLGYTPERSPPEDNSVTRSAQPSADSGYGSVTESRSDIQDARNAPPARIDSGPVPNRSPAPSSRRGEHEEKMLINPPTSKSRSRGGSNSGIAYISRLDPGPSGSNFSEPVNFSRPSLEMMNTRGSTPPRSTGVDKTQQERPALQPIQTNDRSDRGRSVYKTAPSSPSYAKPQPQYAQPARSMSSASRQKSENPFPYLSETVSNSNTSRKVQPKAVTPPAQEIGQAVTMPTSKFNTLTTQANRSIDRRESSSHAPPKKNGARYADGATLLALQANNPGTSKTSATPTPAAAVPTPVPNAVPTNKVSTQALHSTSTQAPNHHPASSNGSDGSTRRSTLPPVSALEGYKVNKRGQVLDEEGDAIGELFEGDLIDCVRQKITAEGEVVDDFGVVVGRVRPVRRGMVPALRYSEDSTRSGFPSPGLQRGMGSQMSSSGDRRESNASQAGGLQQPSRGRASSRVVSAALTSQTVISPVDTQGNAIMAELDASTVAESFPVMDHSDIFIPTFGSSTRNQSPSQLIKAELPADERRPSIAPSEASRDPSPAEQRPKKWASRYFDPGPDESGSPTTSRRNSQSPATRPTLRTQSQPASRRNSQAQTPSTPIMRGDIVSSPVAATPVVTNGFPPIAAVASPRTSTSTAPIAASPRSSTPTSGWNSPSAFKAVLGPTLEDLAEEPPSRALSQSSKAGRSTPNLHSETQRGSVTPPRAGSPVGSRRASLQGGLGPRTSYQPMRRSPLSNYEATPPGSADPTRSVSQRASASVPANVSSPRDSEDADAAPAPEIPKARVRPGRKPTANVLEKTKSVDRRKSRFSMFLGKKEPVVVS